MKKNFLMIALFTIALAFSACSDDDNDNTVIPYDNLPAESKQFITDHFADYDITKTVQLASSYTVSLSKKTKSTASGGYEIEFDRQGEWIEIEGRNDAVLPDNVLALIPRSILSYVSQNYQGRGITEIKKETYGYKIDLTGKLDVELKFDYNGEFLAADNDDDDDVVIEFGNLPESSQTFLNTHFKGLTPSKVNKDNDGYDVKYANDTDVEFDLLGNWYKVEVEKDQMPQTVIALFPQKIQDYISSNFSSKKVESIKNKISTYEVELNGDIDLVFDKEGNLWNSNGNNNNNNNGQRLQFSALPQAVQSYLTEHFLTATTFLYAEQDDDEYEVKLANGTKVDFYIKGDMKSVEVLPGNSVPDSVVLGAILSYVKTNYPDKKIEEYEKKTIGFKVELSGYPELELIFDSNGNFKGLDR
ncbi:MAG: PepSY-like domain-containing protein [Prevotella sp.]|jgi:hypothetical protein|nr:PepSY-like domain-containing protein [Prevotella sp.]